MFGSRSRSSRLRFRLPASEVHCPTSRLYGNLDAFHLSAHFTQRPSSSSEVEFGGRIIWAALQAELHVATHNGSSLTSFGSRRVCAFIW
jgi:hypothetical protein